MTWGQANTGWSGGEVGASSGAAAPEFTRLKSLHGATLTSAGQTSAFSLNTTTGLWEITWADTTASSDGWDEGDKYKIPLDDILGATYDPDRYLLELLITEASTFPMNGNQPQVSFGIVGGAGGVVFALHNNISSAKQLRMVNNTVATVPATTATNYGKTLISASLLKGTRLHGAANGANGTSWGVSIADEGQVVTSSTYHLVVSAQKPGASNANGESWSFYIDYRIVDRGTAPT